MLEKIKVNELAKKLNISSKNIIEALAKFDIQIKSHATVLEERQLDMIFEVLTQEKDAGGEFSIPKKPAVAKAEELLKEEPVKEAKTEPVAETQKEEQPVEKKVKKPSNPQPFQKREKQPKQKSDKPKQERVAVVVNTRSEAVPNKLTPHSVKTVFCVCMLFAFNMWRLW